MPLVEMIFLRLPFCPSFLQINFFFNTWVTIAYIYIYYYYLKARGSYFFKNRDQKKTFAEKLRPEAGPQRRKKGN